MVKKFPIIIFIFNLIYILDSNCVLLQRVTKKNPYKITIKDNINNKSQELWPNEGCDLNYKIYPAYGSKHPGIDEYCVVINQPQFTILLENEKEIFLHFILARTGFYNFFYSRDPFQVIPEDLFDKYFDFQNEKISDVDLEFG